MSAASLTGEKWDAIDLDRAMLVVTKSLEQTSARLILTKRPASNNGVVSMGSTGLGQSRL